MHAAQSRIEGCEGLARTLRYGPLGLLRMRFTYFRFFKVSENVLARRLQPCAAQQRPLNFSERDQSSVEAVARTLQGILSYPAQ